VSDAARLFRVRTLFQRGWRRRYEAMIGAGWHLGRGVGVLSAASWIWTAIVWCWDILAWLCIIRPWKG
jgi:hypothetical protein